VRSDERARLKARGMRMTIAEPTSTSVSLPTSVRSNDDARTIADAIAFLDEADANADLTSRDLRKVRRVRAMLAKELAALAYKSLLARYCTMTREQHAPDRERTPAQIDTEIEQDVRALDGLLRLQAETVNAVIVEYIAQTTGVHVEQVRECLIRVGVPLPSGPPQFGYRSR